MWQTFYTITEKIIVLQVYMHTLPDIPAGYEYDFIVMDLHDIKMDKKCLLFLPTKIFYFNIRREYQSNVLKVLKKIASLVEEGVAVFRQRTYFSLGSNLDNADEFKALVTSI